MSNTQVVSEGSRGSDLDSLLLPNTPTKIRNLYYALESDASTKEFGPLEDGVVILDTETTGLSFRDCELIEIAAARLQGREVVERFQTFVHPSKPIPRETQRLTGISELDVHEAPCAKDAVASLAQFVGGAPVLAHNATFDKTFIEKAPGGRDVSDYWIDTLALSRMALPMLKSHRLSDMARAFHCDSVTHRASDDVDALCGMWRIMLCGLDQMPSGLLGYLSDMHEDVKWAFRPVLSYIASLHEPTTFDLKAVRKELLSLEAGDPRTDAATLPNLAAPPKHEVESYFGADGPLARISSSYEHRTVQVRMADEVRDALATSSHRVIEAGTGVGKSMAYLVPEVLFAKKNHITVGVATKTNVLADQLVGQELPRLNAVLEGGLTYYTLKGYEHYPCLLRMQHSLEESAFTSLNDDAKAEALTALAVSYAYVCQTPDGDLDALGIRWKLVPRDALAISSGDCIHNRCPFFPDECLVHGARRRAACADVIVTNHALLLRDIAAEKPLLPPVRHWVIDEAHGFEAEARTQWSQSLSGEAMSRLFEELGDTKTGVLHELMVANAPLESSTLVVGLLSKVSGHAVRSRASLEDLFDAIHGLGALEKDKGEYGSNALWIDDAVRGSEEWSAVAAAADTCLVRLSDTLSALEQTREALNSEHASHSGALDGITRRLKGYTQCLRLVVQGNDSDYVYYAQLYRQTKYRSREGLVAQKLDIGSELAPTWLGEMKSVVFTSATLSVGGSFDHFDHSVGLDLLPKAQYKNLVFESSFDFDNNMAIVVAEDMPSPSQRGYLDALSELLYDIHTSMGGSVLTLFTNRREMEKVYQRVQPELAAQGLDLICQDRGSSPRRLREKFLNNKATSLFALKSFWEGFDAAGDTLRCVVITKLPFASPRDPLVRERDLRDRRSWWKYSLPEAIISVKQASGRLIRSADDKGIVVLADSRVATKRYGKQVLDSLPSHNRIFLGKDKVGRYIRTWRNSRE